MCQESTKLLYKETTAISPQDKEVIEIFNIPIINKECKYWLLRTNSGTLWEIFKKEGYVSIGWNKLTDFKFLKPNSNITKHDDKIKSVIKEFYPETSAPGSILSPLRNFIFNMKVGDIIIIPSEHSQILSFGKITSDCYINENPQGSDEHKKRRSVKWISDLPKAKANLDIYKMLQANQALTDTSKYSSSIDREIYPLYYKEGKFHFTIRITTKDPVGKNLASLQNLFYDESLISANIHTKINVQSPGYIELISENKEIIIAIIVLFFIVGGKIGSIEQKGILGVFNSLLSSKKTKAEITALNQKTAIEKYDRLQKEFGEDLCSLNLDLSKSFEDALKDGYEKIKSIEASKDENDTQEKQD